MKALPKGDPQAAFPAAGAGRRVSRSRPIARTRSSASRSPTRCASSSSAASASPCPEDVWRDKELPAHLRMNFRVVDEAGRELAVGRDLLALKGQLGQAAQLTFGKAEPGIEREGLRAWDFGDLPEEIAFTRGGRRLTGYPGAGRRGRQRRDPALRREARGRRGDARRRAAAPAHRAQGADAAARERRPGFPAARRCSCATRRTPRTCARTSIDAIADRAFIGEDALPRTQKAFEAQRARARTRLPAVTEAATRLFAHDRGGVPADLDAARVASKGPLARPAADIRAQLSRLVYKGFFSATPWERLAHLPRYLKAMRCGWTSTAATPSATRSTRDSIAQLDEAPRRAAREAAQGRRRRSAPRGIPLAPGGAARVALRAGAEDAVSGVLQAAGEDLEPAACGTDATLERMKTDADKSPHERIEQVVALVRRKIAKEEQATLERFVREYFRQVDPEDLAERLPEDLYGIALSHWSFARRRAPGAPKLRVFNPAVEEHGWQSTHTVVEIVNDDMPFLVDSVTMAANRCGLTLHLIIHPIVAVRRDAGGNLIGLAADGEGTRESFIHVEVDRVTEAAQLERLTAEVTVALDDVRAAVDGLEADGRQVARGPRRDRAPSAAGRRRGARGGPRFPRRGSPTTISPSSATAATISSAWTARMD